MTAYAQQRLMRAATPRGPKGRPGWAGYHDAVAKSKEAALSKAFIAALVKFNGDFANPKSNSGFPRLGHSYCFGDADHSNGRGYYLPIDDYRRRAYEFLSKWRESPNSGDIVTVKNIRHLRNNLRKINTEIHAEASLPDASVRCKKWTVRCYIDGNATRRMTYRSLGSRLDERRHQLRLIQSMNDMALSKGL